MVNNAQKPKQVSLSQVRHQMMKQKTTETVKVETPKPNNQKPTEVVGSTEVATNQPKQKPIQKQKVVSEKKENFAARTMKGFMKLIGADKEQPVEATEGLTDSGSNPTRTPNQPPAKTPVKTPVQAPPKVISVNKKELERTDSGDKSVLKMIQTRLKQKTVTEKSEEEKAKAEKSAVYMDQFRVQGSRLLLSSQHLNLSPLFSEVWKSTSLINQNCDILFSFY